MAVKKLLIAIGQSNADPIGDDVGWLIAHPNANFILGTPQISVGSKTDMFTMPGNFPGYGTINLRGLAMPSVKYLTFYNASASGYWVYPGTGMFVNAGVTGTNTTTDGITIFPRPAAVNALEPQATVSTRIKRALTGTIHTITANTTGTDYKIQITPALSPASIAGEQFYYELVKTSAAAAGGASTEEKKRIEFGIAWENFNAQVGSLLNVKIRCTQSFHAGNVGQIRTIVGMFDRRTVIVDSEFSGVPHEGDRFEFEFASDHISSSFTTTPATGRFDKWAYFLPWCPLEGSSYSQAPGINKTNPYPPGFNYLNDYSTPYWFSLIEPSTPYHTHQSAFHSGLGMRFKQLFGEEIYICNLGISATTLVQRETGLNFNILPGAGGNPTYGGWIDPVAHSNWSPGSPNSLYSRLLDILDTAVAAAAADGHTIEVIGVFNSQGESDTQYSVWADAYEDNLRTFKSLVRNAIKSRGMYSGLAETIPWIQGKITTNPWGAFAPLVRKAVEKLAYEDPYMETFETNSFEKAPNDTFHYSGFGISQWEAAAFEAWQRATKTGTTEVDICNLALSHLGEGTKITSINPTDGSVQSSYCATFYPIARNSLLEMQTWNFAMRREELVETTNTSTEWDYAYVMPANAVKIVSILPPDSSDDYSTTFAAPSSTYYTAPVVAAGTYNPQAFAIEIDSDGKQVIYSDQPDAVVRYVDRITDTRMFSQQFVIALSWHLASMLAGPVIKGDVGAAEAKRCQQMLMLYLGKAETHDATQRNIKPEQITPWISGR